jgi:bifunctional DNA-binding transcriptional regulator/antitoxin component of YhaV-PrlF toxin-antitoxin module
MLNIKVPILKKGPVTFSAKVYANGKTTIPTALKRKLDLNDGEDIVYIEKEDGIMMTTQKHLLAQLQEKLKNSKNAYTVDDFIAERRLEAKKELEDSPE